MSLATEHAPRPRRRLPPWGYIIGAIIVIVIMVVVILARTARTEAEPETEAPPPTIAIPERP